MTLLARLRRPTVDTTPWSPHACEHCTGCACNRAFQRRHPLRADPLATLFGAAPFSTAPEAQPSSRPRPGRLSSLRDRNGEPADGRSDADQPTLAQLCHLIQQGFFERAGTFMLSMGGCPSAAVAEAVAIFHIGARADLCIQNMGRPAAAALTDVVRGAVLAAQAGLSLDRLRLQLEFSGNGGEGAVDAAGYRLTESERRYRLQWLDTVYLTYQMMAGAGTDSRDAPAAVGQRSDADAWLLAIVERVLAGQDTGDEQSSVSFDRALATGGASGGAAAERRVIAPQFVPVSQIVLLTVKVQRELEAQLAA